MAVDADALTSLANVRAYLDLGVSTYDTMLEDFIDRVTDQFETYCSRYFKAADYTEYLDGKGLNILFPKQWPINSVASIYDDSDWAWGETTVIDSDDYRIVDDIYVQLKSSVFTKYIQNIKITYNAGYTTIPEDLEQAAIEQVAWLFRKNQGQLEGVTSKSLGDGSITYYGLAILPGAVEVLNRYQRKNLA